MQAGGSAGGAHRGPSAGISRIWMVRGILALALSLGGLAAATLALPGHVSAGHARVTVHQRTHAPARPAGVHLTVTKAIPKPWMY